VTLDWDELNPRQPSDHYTVRTVPARLATLRVDPWRDYWTTRQRIPADAISRLDAIR
jgi:bifunctional non-homologous end joining protein LigD